MIINVKKLRDTLGLLKPVVPRGKKVTLPILTNVLLHDGRAMATDLTVHVAIDLEEANEACLLPLAGALAFLERVPGHLDVALIPKMGHTGSEVTLDCDVQYITTLDCGGVPDDYPPIVQVDASETMLDGYKLVTGMAEVLECAATEDRSRPVLTGVHLTLGPEIKVVGADGFRMAVKTLGELAPEAEVKTAIIPGQAVKVLQRLWKKGPKSLDFGSFASIADLAVAKRLLGLTLTESHVRFRLGAITLIAHLVQGTYPNYAQLIPTPEHWVQVDAQDLSRAVSQVDIHARESSNIVRLEWRPGDMAVSAQSDTGRSRATLAADCPEPGRIAFNYQYLLGYLSHREGPVSIGITDPSSPTLWRHNRSADYILMPMFVRWGDETEDKAEASEPDPVSEGGNIPESLGVNGEIAVETPTEAP